MSKARKPALKTSKHGGRALAWTGLLMGFGVSVSGNIADEFVKSTDPEPGALFFGFFWPFALLFTTEVMARIDWPRHWVWLVARLLGLAPVAFVAAWLSYWHLVSLIQHYGEDFFSAHIAPLAIDGFMLMNSVALMAPSAVAKAAARLPKPAVVIPVEAPAAPARRLPDITDLIPVGEGVLATLTADGGKVSKTAFGEALRAEGVKAGRDKVSALYTHLVTA